MVLFFLKKHKRTKPSHSVKFIGGGGYLGSILTTDDSTFGGGLKLFFDTFIR